VFDTLLTRDIKLPALMAEVVSFCWLAWQIDPTRSREATAVQAAPARA